MWTAYSWDNVEGRSGGGRAPARMVRCFQMPGDAFGQYRMFAEVVWCLNYPQLFNVDSEMDEKLPPGLVEFMKKDSRAYVETSWTQLIEFESAITDAEVHPVQQTDFASQQQPSQRMLVAACDPDHTGVWNGEWEECEVLKTHDTTYDLSIIADGEECFGVQHRHVQQIHQVAQCGPDHVGRRSPPSRTRRTHHSPSPLITHHSPLNLHPNPVQVDRQLGGLHGDSPRSRLL